MNSQIDFSRNIKAISGLDLMLTVDHSGKKLLDWAEENKQAVERWLQKKGAIVLRGLNVTGSQQFGKLLRILFDAELLSYEHRSTPRTALRGNIYTATEYHADQMIVQHNEQAYTNSWPMRIGFYCMLPSDEGGETPIASSLEVYKKIPVSIRQEFIDKGVLYVRNYSDLDLPWSEVFGTDDTGKVEEYCRENNIEFEWVENKGLRTKQTLPAVCKHPATGDELWFNQAHLFHSSTLGRDLHEVLLQSLGNDCLPRNSYYGDGSEIDTYTINTIVDIYQSCKTSFRWKQGDVMLLDNMLFSHGREPFSGERKVLTAMARSHTL